MAFDYRQAFSRNIGWVTALEQEILRTKRIAIAGLGGVGGSHLLTLTRLGVGCFNIADLDKFELANFNRQAGANLATIDKPKADVLAQQAKDINPELDINVFNDGVTADNLDEFLEGVDVYVDALDFFALDARKAVFAACHAKGIPAVTAAPIGMGAALLCFMPGQMSFEEYFQLEGQSEDEQALRFLLGLSPAMLQMPYLVDDSRVDFNARKGPSTAMACELCAGFAGTWTLQLLLNRKGIPAAPKGVHFDAYRNKLAKTWRPWGNNNPIQQLGLRIARQRVMAKTASATAVEAPTKANQSIVAQILDIARWAPSGDNEQPWRFEHVDDQYFVIHGHDTRDWCVYDLDGRASQVALGALLETIAIGAAERGFHAAFKRQNTNSTGQYQIDVHLEKTNAADDSDLGAFIKHRVTQRRPLETRPLLPAQKKLLETAVGPDFKIIWLEGTQLRWQMARLLFRSAHIRLTIPEAYEVHRQNIEWGAQFSENKIPDQAIGVDGLTLKVMRWTLQSWHRVQTMNRYLGGTWPPRLQMDLLPGYCCAAHFMILSKQSLATVDNYLDGGRAVQRFWLQATGIGLQLQPEMTPLIFSRYANQTVNFTDTSPANARAAAVAVDLQALFGGADLAANGVFLGRIGFGRAPVARSIRQPLSKLTRT